METLRTHDQLYLKEDRKNKPKEYFKFLAAQSSDFIQALPSPKILDIGCATGDFLYYLSQQFPDAKLHGVDVVPALLDRAKSEVPRANFFAGNLAKPETLPQEKFDAIFMSGVHTIFSDLTWLTSSLPLMRDHGRLYVFGPFNPEKLDVLVQVRPSSQTGPWEVGWNLFSKKTVSDFLQRHGWEFRFIDWESPIDFEKNPTDPLRSWTIRKENGGRLVVNGTQLVHHFSLLEIKR
jgi:SAM-dependent methyltransferase